MIEGGKQSNFTTKQITDNKNKTELRNSKTKLCLVSLKLILLI